MDKATQLAKIEDDNIKVRTENALVVSQMDDLKLEFDDLKREKEISQKSVEYYLKQLKESRDEYQKLLQMLVDTQEKLETYTNPQFENDNPHAIEIKKLNLKIEGLQLVNAQMNQSVIDSKAVIKVIEQTCIKEVEKMEEIIKAHISSICYRLQHSSDAENQSQSSKLTHVY